MRLIQATVLTLLVFGVGLASVRAQGRNTDATVNAYYQQYFARPAEPNALNVWGDYLSRNGAAATQAALLGSDEYYTRRGSSPEGFIAGLYVDVLGRSASPAEIQGWLPALNSSPSRAQFAAQFLTAAQTELAQRARQREQERQRRPVLPPHSEEWRRDRDRDHYRDWDRERERDRHPPWSPFAPRHDHR